jgi:hypothetical protein
MCYQSSPHGQAQDRLAHTGNVFRLGIHPRRVPQEEKGTILWLDGVDEISKRRYSELITARFELSLRVPQIVAQSHEFVESGYDAVLFF